MQKKVHLFAFGQITPNFDEKRQKSEKSLAGNKSLHLLAWCPFPGKCVKCAEQRWALDPLNPLKDDLWKQSCASNTVECGQRAFFTLHQ